MDENAQADGDDSVELDGLHAGLNRHFFNSGIERAAQAIEQEVEGGSVSDEEERIERAARLRALKVSVGAPGTQEVTAHLLHETEDIINWFMIMAISRLSMKQFPFDAVRRSVDLKQLHYDVVFRINGLDAPFEKVVRDLYAQFKAQVAEEARKMVEARAGRFTDLMQNLESAVLSTFPTVEQGYVDAEDGQ